MHNWIITKEEHKWSNKKQCNCTIIEIIDPITNKRYRGTAYCHPDDTEYESKIIGGHIAHLRALQNAAAAKARYYKEQEEKYQEQLKVYLENLGQFIERQKK